MRYLIASMFVLTVATGYDAKKHIDALEHRVWELEAESTMVYGPAKPPQCATLGSNSVDLVFIPPPCLQSEQ